MKSKPNANLAKEFAPHFPTLVISGANTLERRCDVVIQSVSFTMLKFGDYRPACNLVVSPCVDVHWVVNVQLMPLAFRTISPHLHNTCFPQVVECVRSTFTPRIDGPFSTRLVLETCMRNNRTSGAFSGPIACGTGYMCKSLGDFVSAKDWFVRALKWYSSLDYAMADWQLRDVAIVKEQLVSLSDID